MKFFGSSFDYIVHNIYVPFSTKILFFLFSIQISALDNGSIPITRSLGILLPKKKDYSIYSRAILITCYLPNWL